ASVPPDIYVGAAQSLVSLYDLNHQTDSADMLLHKIAGWDFVPADSYLAFQYRFFRARTHRKLRAYTEAQAELEALVELVCEQTEPEMRLLYTRVLQEEGILFLETGAYSKAEKTLLQAYTLAAADKSRDYLLTEISNNVAQVYDKLHIYDKALLYYQESLKRCNASYEEGALPCVTVQNNVAGILLKEGEFAEAINTYEFVVNAFERWLDPSDPLYITALNNLATAYRKNGEWKKARIYLDKVWNLL